MSTGAPQDYITPYPLPWGFHADISLPDRLKAPLKRYLDHIERRCNAPYC